MALLSCRSTEDALFRRSGVLEFLSCTLRFFVLLAILTVMGASICKEARRGWVPWNLSIYFPIVLTMVESIARKKSFPLITCEVDLVYKLLFGTMSMLLCLSRKMEIWSSTDASSDSACIWRFLFCFLSILLLLMYFAFYRIVQEVRDEMLKELKGFNEWAVAYFRLFTRVHKYGASI